MPIALLARKKFQFIFPRPNFTYTSWSQPNFTYNIENIDLFIFDRQLDFRAEDT